MFEVRLFYMWRYIYSESLFNTLSIEIKPKCCKKSPLDKTNFTKIESSNSSQFFLNSRFLYELKHKIRFSKSMCGIFHYPFHLVFVKVYIFVQQTPWILWL